jgi:hypothetical protein
MHKSISLTCYGELSVIAAQRKTYDDRETKYATWSIRSLGCKEEEPDKISSENRISVTAIAEAKEKLKCTKYTNIFRVSYSGVNRNIRSRSGVMIYIYETIHRIVENYKFWNEDFQKNWKN